MARRPHPETGYAITFCNRCRVQLHYAPTIRKAAEHLEPGDVIVATHYTEGHSADIITAIEPVTWAGPDTIGLRAESGGLFYGEPGQSFDIVDPDCDTHRIPAGARL